MNRLLHRSAGAALALGLCATAALAQTAIPAVGPIDGVVNIPWGDWIADSAQALIWVLGALVMWGIRLLPARITAILQTAQVEQILDKAIEFGINKTAGAVKGEKMSITIANQVLEQAMEYAVAYAPTWLIKWVGGTDGLKDKITARLPIAKDAAL